MAANATQHRSVRALCEGAIMVALAQILAYLKLYELPQGGSITLAMVPIFFFAVRWGWKKGLGCALQHLRRHRGRLCGPLLGPLGGGRHHLG